MAWYLLSSRYSGVNLCCERQTRAQASGHFGAILISLFPNPSMEQEGASLGPGDFNPLAPHLIHPHGQHVPVPGPLSPHGHLPPPGFISDPASLSPRVISPSIRAFLGLLFFHHTLLSNPLSWEPLRNHFNSCPKLLGTTEKSLR